MNTIIDSLRYGLIYSIGFMLCLLIFGLVFSLIEKRNSRSIYAVFGRWGLIVTGLIGTVCHELSHILFCIIFRHKIEEFSLFRPLKSRYDGIMGYVNHSCDRRSPYQNIGNFFIGIGPIVFGTGFLILTMALILPQAFANVMSAFNRYMVYMSNIESARDSVNIYISIILTIISNLNPFNQVSMARYLLFIYIMFSITSHMDLSKEDLKNSQAGFVAFLIFVFSISFICVLIGKASHIFILKILVCVFGFLTVGLIFAVITMTISFLIESIFA